MNLILKNFPNELHQTIKVLAAQQGIALYKLIIKLLEKSLNGQKKTEN